MNFEPIRSYSETIKFVAQERLVARVKQVDVEDRMVLEVVHWVMEVKTE
jgi:hypothetical protein